MEFELVSRAEAIRRLSKAGGYILQTPIPNKLFTKYEFMQVQLSDTGHEKGTPMVGQCFSKFKYKICKKSLRIKVGKIYIYV